MTNIAWKNLAREKTRLGISVGGVAFAVLLILVLMGLYSGILAQSTEYIRSVDTDLWVAEAGTPGDFFHSVSLLPEDLEAQIEAVDGVEEALPLVGAGMVFRLKDQDVDFRLMGVDPDTGVGGPPRVVEGEALPGPGEIVVDRVFADNFDVRIGDTLNVRGTRLRVVGIASGGNTIVSQYAWASFGEVAGLLEIPGIVNYFLVRTEGDPGSVGARIAREVPEVQAMTVEEFGERNTADIREGFVPIISVLVGIAFVVGIAVIGLTIYTATLEKSREYGVLKAIGFSNRRLYGVVFQQSLVAGVAGFAVGTALAYVLGAVLGRLVPQFATAIGPVHVGFAAGAALLMALISAFIPARPVARLDPAQVLRV